MYTYANILQILAFYQTLDLEDLDFSFFIIVDHKLINQQKNVKNLVSKRIENYGYIQ